MFHRLAHHYRILRDEGMSKGSPSSIAMLQPQPFNCPFTIPLSH